MNRLAAVLLLLFLFAVFAGACRDRQHATSGTEKDASAQEASAAADAASATPTVPALPPLDAEWIQKLTLDDGSEAFVAVPIGATEPRPVVAGIHGAGDRPDWSCSEWHATTNRKAWVVCPRGIPSQWKDYWVWGSAESIAQRTEKAMVMLRARYPKYVADGPMIYGGWSQGGSLASTVIAAHPGMFDRAVMLEIGHTPLDASAVIGGLKAGGVKRAIVHCSSIPCRELAKGLVRAASRAELPFAVNDVGLRGHWFDGPVFESLGQRMPWLVEDDPRWTGLTAP